LGKAERLGADYEEHTYFSAENFFFPIVDREAPLAYIGAIIKAIIYGL